jgi:hypothetical protein
MKEEYVDSWEQIFIARLGLLSGLRAGVSLYQGKSNLQ